MNNTEWSNQFDTLLDSYKFRSGYGTTEDIYSIKLDEYEKSIYLTNAQSSILRELYSGRNLTGRAYEQSEELRRYLANLNTTEYITDFKEMGNLGLSVNSLRCKISKEVLWITQEQCELESDSDPCINGSLVETFPVLRDEYNRIKNNPFRYRNRVWRIDLADNSVELISRNKIKGYKVSYIRKPLPIILEDLGDLSIDGISTETNCELDITLHKDILERAVEEAYRYMSTKVQEQSSSN